MKVLLVCLFVAGGAFAAFPQGALLVFPSQGSNDTSTTTTTPAPQNDGKVNLEQINAEIMERLKQEVGSQQGVYHIYLPDGRLQKVQYTAAPVKQQETEQNRQVPPESDSNAKQQDSNAKQQDSNGFTVIPKAVYFVQVPADRAQNLKVPQAPEARNTTEQNNQTSAQEAQTQDSPAQYKQEAAQGNQPQYLPITVVTVDQLSQLRSAQGVNQAGQYSGKQQADTAQNQPTFNTQTPAGQEPGADQQSYVASLRYSQVEPITGPVYSYSPLVRILRYASD